MRDKLTSLRSTFSVGEEVVKGDTRFLNIVIDIMHDGVNLNKSCFDREVVDSCIDSIKNTPVLGFIKNDKITGESDFNGHEYILTRTENGVDEIYIGRAYGVIPESCNPRWVTKVCPDGVERDFVQVDALVWEKFSDASSIIKRDGEKAQSMELEVSSVEGFEDENGIFHFTQFKFDGACILGDNVPPAMVGSSVKIDNGVNFTMSDIADSIRSELNNKLELFNDAFADLVRESEKCEQGGVKNMSETNTDFAQTVVEQLEDMSNIVMQYESVENRWGESVPRFNLVDVQDNEVIVMDRTEGYHYYGFPFVLNGDKPEIDFACGGARKKVKYVNYEDGVDAQQMFDLGEHITNIEKDAFSKVDEAEAKVAEFEESARANEEVISEFEAKIAEADAKVAEAGAKIAEFESKLNEIEQANAEVTSNYEMLKADYDEIKPKFDEYVAAEEQRAIDELNSRKSAIFAEFESDLAENADFAALKENSADMSLEDIEKECAFLYVRVSRANAASKFSAQDSSAAVVGVINDSDNDELDGVVLTKYGYISTNR